MGLHPPEDGGADVLTRLEEIVTEFTPLIDRYIESWNETDPQRRRDMIARTWTDEGNYVDPLFAAKGHDGIDAMLQGVQAQFPGFRFRRTSEVDAHHDRVRFAWELGPESGPAMAGGVDFGVVVDGRLQAITGFLDFAPAPAGA
jgi:SnoaL-like domain